MIAALILAAGTMPGGMIPAMCEIDGISPVRRVISVFRSAGIARIVVVTGHDAESVERHCAHMGVTFLRSTEFEKGDMLSSVKTGIGYLRGKCSRVFISPADTPLFSIDIVRRLECDDAPVVIPAYGNKPGHPLLLSSELFDYLMGFEGRGGLESALSGDIKRRYIDVPDVGILADFSKSPKEVKSISKAAIRAEARVRLTGDRAFFGPGTLQLLRLTEEAGSLKHAAHRMGVSYSKAIKMALDIERQLGFPVLVSKQGGHRGGGSEITVRGAQFIRLFETFESECTELIGAAFERHFAKFINDLED